MAVLSCLGTAFLAYAATVDPFYQRNDQVKTLLDQIDAKQDKIDALQKAATDYAKKADTAVREGKTLQDQLGALDNLLTKVQLDIQSNELNIDRNKLQIDAINFQIADQEAEIAQNKDRLAEYIKLLAKQDRQSYLELIILNKNFSDFFTQLNAAQELQAEIRKSVDRLELLKTALETRRAELSLRQDDLEKARIALEQNKERYQEDVTAKEVLLTETKSNEQRYQRLLVEAKQQQNAIDSDILNIEEQVKQKIARLRVGGSTAKTTLVGWPVDNSRGISAYFHDPGYPFRHVYEHPAIDIRAYQSTPIQAPADGYVSRTADNGYGYSYVILIHDNGISTVYGHVSKILVREDQFVKAGDVIALSGGKPGTKGAGNMTTGPHLHFEVRLNGIPVNPLDYLP